MRDRHRPPRRAGPHGPGGRLRRLPAGEPARRAELPGRRRDPVVNRLGYMEEPIAGPVAASAAASAGGRGAGAYRRHGQHRRASPPSAACSRTSAATFTGSRDGIDVKVDRARYAGGHDPRAGRVEYRTQTRDGVPVSLDLDSRRPRPPEAARRPVPGPGAADRQRPRGPRPAARSEYRFGHRARARRHRPRRRPGPGASGTGLPIAGDLPITLDRGVVSGRDLHLTSPGQDITSSGFTYDIPRGHRPARLPAGEPGRGAARSAAARQARAAGEPPPFWLPTARGGARPRGASPSPATTTPCGSSSTSRTWWRR